MGVSKECRKYKAGNKYCISWMEKKLPIGSNNNPNELHNQRWEILNVCGHRKTCSLSK